MKTRRLLSVACSALLLTQAAKADHAAYLTHQQLQSITDVVAPPSEPNSSEDRTDRAAGELVYANRSVQDVRQAQREVSFDVFNFDVVYGDHFNAKTLPRTAALFDEVLQEESVAIDAAKNHWRRPRPCPFNDCRETAEKAAAFTKKSFSYPSGHSTRATLFAWLLAYVDPAHADALMNYSQSVGWRRIVFGVHTPQDIYAGRVLGQALAHAMLNRPDMKHDLEALREEWRQAGLLPVSPNTTPQQTKIEEEIH